MAADKSVLLEVQNLKKYFPVHKGMGKALRLKAVDDVSFKIYRGETFGLVGESGCGKTTIGRTVIRLYRPTSGKILFDGTDIAKLSERELFAYRRRMQIIFQDPYASLDSRMTVCDIVGESLDIHKIAKGAARYEKVIELLRSVGLNEEHATRYPHEFSGGQRQRIGLARALALNPEFIVCDEPISALDVSIQAQVINLLEDLQKSMGLTYLFIAHDLSMVQHISARVGVMYLGHLMEVTTSANLFGNPLHPYTQALLSAIPIPDPDEADKRKRIILQGDVPTPIEPPPGCPFASRCLYAGDICRKEMPELRTRGEEHFVACHMVD